MLIFFFLISFFIAVIQVILGLIVNPFLLNKSRTLLRETEVKQVSSLLKLNDFSDSLKGVTFYIDKKNANGELVNIFIKDSTGTLNLIVNEVNSTNNTTIFAKKGFVSENKLILFDGTIQTLNEKKEIKNVQFKKTELNISKFSNRTIKQAKIQETSSLILFKCMLNKDINIILENCSFQNNKKIVIENLSRRIGMPLYIPLVSIIASFLLIYSREKKYNFIKKYIIFGFAFIILVFAEILLRYTGFSTVNVTLYFFSPLIIFIILYFILIKNLNTERITR